MKRFPVGLTIASILAFAVLIGLGLWQVHRLAWKEDLLARIDRLRTAPALPLAAVLGGPSRERDVEYRRVTADCLPPRTPAHDAYRYALRDGQVGWRLISACPLAASPYDGILVDRGLASQFTGAMAPGVASAPPPGAVVGVLRSPGAHPLLGPAETTTAGSSRVFRVLDRQALESLAKQNGLRHPAPYILAAESEDPPPAGLIPAALPRDIPNNHFVYAVTWFALAGVLAWIYGAMLQRRLRGR